jgi:hypothetical protein
VTQIQTLCAPPAPPNFCRSFISTFTPRYRGLRAINADPD